MVLPIYSAGEKAIHGVDSRQLCEGIKDHGHKEVVYADGIEPALSSLTGILKPGDVLLTLGAGDVWKVGTALLNET